MTEEELNRRRAELFTILAVAYIVFLILLLRNTSDSSLSIPAAQVHYHHYRPERVTMNRTDKGED